jgi:hypothetical protein
VPARGRSRTFWRHPAAAPALAILGLLLVLWPFVRQPPPSLARAWAELMIAWAVGVVVLHRLSRRRDPAPPDGGRDG